MPTLDRETRQLINAARTLGNGPLSIYLDDNELLRLCAVIAADLQIVDIFDDRFSDVSLQGGYYSVPLTWLRGPAVSAMPFQEVFTQMRLAEVDFPTYFKALCELHKRRLKFQLILEHQALPQLEQILPRCLLEYGLKPSETLASWLLWRKWLYDIDNRAAQETGYLFEPILAASLGGISYAASKSPIRRADTPTRRRQVDCIDGKTAYEFKMRVTIAANGQGRFKEELDFARDCNASGYVPILLVLDATPSSRLDELIREYARYDGNAYIGGEAWQHVEDKAGRVMGQFVEKYVRVPFREVNIAHKHLQSITLAQTDAAIEIRIGNDRFTVARTGPQIDLTDVIGERDQA